MLEASYSLLNEYQLILHMTSLVILYKQNSPVDTHTLVNAALVGT